MALKAIDIINRAMSKIGVKRPGIPLEDDDISDAIAELNDMMTEIDASGTKLGYTIVSFQDDDITTPDWSYGAIRANLAIRLAPDYDTVVSPALAQQAAESWKIVLKRTVEIGETNFPDTLPVGQGNEYWNYQRFFVDEYRNDLMTGSGGTLADAENINIQEDL